MARTARAFLLLVTLAVTVGAAACGGDSGPVATAEAAERVKGAVDSTLAAGSARVVLSADFDTGSVKSTLSGDGVFDFPNRRGQLRLDLGSLSALVGGGPVDAIVEGGIVYIKVPPDLLPGAEWIKLDVAEAAQMIGLDLGALTPADPGQVLEVMRGVSDDVRKVGSEKLRGTNTTHYRATIDVQALAARVSPDAAPDVGTGTLPLDVWVDGDGRMRKLEVKIDRRQGEGSLPTGTVVLELFDFGVPVAVQAPPAAKVYDFGGLLGGG